MPLPTNKTPNNKPAKRPNPLKSNVNSSIDRNTKVRQGTIQKRAPEKSTSIENRSGGVSRNRKKPQQNRKPVTKTLPKRKKAKTKTFVDRDGHEWAIDGKTGKKYRVLPSAPDELVAAAKKGHYPTRETLLNNYEEIDDFDVNDLNATASLFMSHLRVPIDRAERERLRKLRAKMMEEQKAAYDAANRADDNEEESF